LIATRLPSVQRGHLLRRAAGSGDRIQLHRAALRAEEIDDLAVRREGRRIDVPAFRREALRRRGIARHQVFDVQRGGGLVRRHVDHALGEHHAAAIRRQRRRGHAFERGKVAHVEAAGGQCVGGTAGEQQGERKDGVAWRHGGSRLQKMDEAAGFPRVIPARRESSAFHA
jgi:hypothetical protein